MRFKSTQNNLKVYAVTGTHSIVLSFDLVNLPQNFLGFAIERTQLDTKKTTWLYGQKCFKSIVPNPAPGQQYPTQIHPVQSFMWKDFTADPGQKYSFKVTAVSGNSKQLIYTDPTTITVQTELMVSGKHSVVFNRGVSGSQAYSEKFGNKKPDDLPGAQKDAAYTWLSNGLYETLVGFVNLATDSSYSLYCAFYEFHYGPFLDVLKAASQRGVDVRVVYGAISEYKDINETAINAAGIQALCKARDNQVKQPHNKFMILLKDGNPIKVSTGSTNISVVGIFGHSNAVHIVDDPAIAKEYLDYWNELDKNPGHADFVPVVERMQPDVTPDTLPNDLSVYFSPRSNVNMLTTYAGIMNRANALVCAVYPFNVDNAFQQVFDQPKNYLRFVLLNQHAADNKITSTDPNLEIVAGSHIQHALDQWVIESDAKAELGAGVIYVHNKFILKDPLSANPVTISGSANFSQPSLTGNDENTLIILNDTRSADIYLTEFIRLFDHFSVREWMNQNPANFKPFLDETYTWFKTYTENATSPEFMRRVLFAGTAGAIES
ncbi:MAG TPA: phospholipase D-like domain-containing protein [Mucilaginibacter sp.]|nr:phospholipase D-like domain-containing protein [Mucilaginibacter sp.]